MKVAGPNIARTGLLFLGVCAYAVLSGYCVERLFYFHRIGVFLYGGVLAFFLVIASAVQSDKQKDCCGPGRWLAMSLLGVATSSVTMLLYSLIVWRLQGSLPYGPEQWLGLACLSGDVGQALCLGVLSLGIQGNRKQLLLRFGALLILLILPWTIRGLIDMPRRLPTTLGACDIEGLDAGTAESRFGAPTAIASISDRCLVLLNVGHRNAEARLSLESDKEPFVRREWHSEFLGVPRQRFVLVSSGSGRALAIAVETAPLVRWQALVFRDSGIERFEEFLF